MVRQPKLGLIYNSDCGGQYVGAAYRKMLERARMRRSVSRADKCYDSAFIESCFSTVKTELEINAYEYARIAEKEITDYIRYYGTRRRYSAVNHMTPEEFGVTSRQRRRPK